MRAALGSTMLGLQSKACYHVPFFFNLLISIRKFMVLVSQRLGVSAFLMSRLWAF